RHDARPDRPPRQRGAAEPGPAAAARRPRVRGLRAGRRRHRRRHLPGLGALGQRAAARPRGRERRGRARRGLPVRPHPRPAAGRARPWSIMGGVGGGARAGVLGRDAAALEALAAVDTLVVDKTGALTEGRPAVSSIVPVPGADENDVLALAARLERGSEHPLAAAIVAEAERRGLPLAPVEGFRSVTGKGVLATVDGRTVALGNEALLADPGRSDPPC